MAIAEAKDEAEALRLARDLRQRLAQNEALIFTTASPAASSAGTLPEQALSRREREVLSLLAEGLLNKEIAQELGIRVRTVEAHREHVRKKLGLRGVADLTKYALIHGFTALPRGYSKPK